MEGLSVASTVVNAHEDASALVENFIEGFECMDSMPAWGVDTFFFFMKRTPAWKLTCWTSDPCDCRVLLRTVLNESYCASAFRDKFGSLEVFVCGI